MMRTLHRGLLLVMVLGLVATGAVVAQQGVGGGKTEADDSQMLEEHLDQIAEQLELSTDQRFKLGDTMERTHELMLEFHHLYAGLMEELNDQQSEALGHMIHTMMSDSLSGPGCGASCSAGNGHGGHHGSLHGKGRHGGHRSGHHGLHKNHKPSVKSVLICTIAKPELDSRLLNIFKAATSLTP